MEVYHKYRKVFEAQMNHCFVLNHYFSQCVWECVFIDILLGPKNRIVTGIDSINLNCDRNFGKKYFLLNFVQYELCTEIIY